MGPIRLLGQDLPFCMTDMLSFSLQEDLIDVSKMYNDYLNDNYNYLTGGY
jgi:hypothetical protein